MAMWDRWDGVNDDDWKAFKSYRDQALPRVLKRVAASTIRPYSEIMELYNRDDWKARVLSYDAHLDAVYQAEREQILKEDARTRTAVHLGLLHDAREAVGNELRKLLAWSERADVNIMQPQQLAKFLEIVVKYERLVVGESTENTSNTFDLSGLSIEDLKTVQGILAKAGQNSPGIDTPALTTPSRSSKPS